MNKAWKTAGFAAAFLGAVGSVEAFDPASQAAGAAPEKTRRIRFIEDDAQDYMVTKVYSLKHIKANDIVPFVLGAVMRYSTNSKVDRINYSAAKQQWIAVTTPVAMMPYVDDMVAKMDRPSRIKDINGSIVRGTGITRYVYNPKWRSSQEMVTLMIKAGIPADASGYNYSADTEDTSAGKYDARVLYDSASNLIYWKDSANKSSDLLKYLAWLDRPVPQVIVSFRLYEIRDSDLRDIGIDYAAWKNGPGLQIAGFGADLFAGRWNETVQVAEVANKLMPFISDSMSWGYGSLFFAPAFDMSFLRLLQQNGRARQLSEVSLTLRNGKSASTSLTPDYQNILKKENDKTYVDPSTAANLTLNISSPTICFNDVKHDKNGLLPCFAEDYEKKFSGIFDFQYELANTSVTERNNYGNELTESSTLQGFGTIRMKQESLLASWSRRMDVEQTIGVPFLCELPILKYIFGTTTRNAETTHFFLTAEAHFVHPDSDISAISGKLTEITELVANEK